MKTWVHESDLLKIQDVLKLNCKFHEARDVMNASAHSSDTVRNSPITYETLQALSRVSNLLEDPRAETEIRAEVAVEQIQEFVEQNLIEATGDKRILLESILEILTENEVYDESISQAVADKDAAIQEARSSVERL